MPDKKSSLSDRIKMKNKAVKADSKDEAKNMKSAISAHLASKQKDAEAKGSSLADRIKAKADKLDADDDKGEGNTKGSLAASLKDKLDAVKGEPLGEEEAAEVEAAVSEANSRYNNLIERVKMTSIVRETSSLGNQIEALPEKVEEIRQRGYKFRAYLEGKIEVFAEQWDDINDRVEKWLEEESEELDDELAKCERYKRRLEGTATTTTKDTVDAFSAVLDEMEAQVEASEGKVKAVYEETRNEVSKTNSQISTVVKHLDWLDESDVELAADEGLYIAAEAEWDDNRDKPDGYIFVTDKRVIFEQREKKGGMMGFGGKKVQETLWEVALDTIEKVTPEDKGMFGGKDMMNMKLGAGAPYAEIVCEIKGGIDSKTWAKQINRAVKGHISQESTVEPDSELIERLRNAPTDCPNCGGTLPKLAAGDNEVSCKYCGSVVRI